MTANTDCILCKCIDDLWYALQGHASDEYDNTHYKRYGLAFDNRDAAVAHARVLASSLGIPDSEIFEDLRAGD